MSARHLALTTALALGACGRVGFDATSDAGGDGAVDPARGAWREVAVGDSHACGIAPEGSLWCWGSNLFAQIDGSGASPLGVTRVDGSTDWARVAAKATHTCAIKTDGSLWCWGLDDGGQVGDGQPGDIVVTPTQVGTERTWREIAVAERTTCGIKLDGTLWCWGTNSWGELGLGLDVSETRATPVQVGTASDWRDLVAGWDTLCAIRAGDAAYCWGENQSGNVGAGTQTPKQPSPTPTWPSHAWKRVVPGDDHTCGIDTGGLLWCWGQNERGALGDGTQSLRITEAQVSGDAWTSVALGRSHTCATRADDSLWCWGDATRAQFGVEDLAPIVVPRRMEASARVVAAEREHTCWIAPSGELTCAGVIAAGQRPGGPQPSADLVRIDDGWAALAMGYVHGCGLRPGGEVACWGRGSIGDGAAVPRQRPSAVSGGYRAIAAGASFTVAIAQDGGLWQWGFLSDLNAVVPTRVGTRTDWQAIEAGWGHACALDATGRLYCWGWNSSGQLGDGTTTDSAVPVQVPGLWAAVSAGGDHTCAITVALTGISCWGANAFGQLGDGSTTPSPAPVAAGVGLGPWAEVAAGRLSTCARDSAGALACWGNNMVYQLATGTQLDSLSPVAATPYADWTGLATADEHACGLRGGDLWCWGHRNELAPDWNQPTRVGAFASYAGGHHVGCALDNAGARWCWGNSRDGQYGDGNYWALAPWSITRP